MEIWIVVIVVLVLAAVLYVSRREGLRAVDEELIRKRVEKESWSQKKFMTYGEVQTIKEELVAMIDEKFGEDEEKRRRLKEIVWEWADLKVKSFQERRSWVRRPKKLS